MSAKLGTFSDRSHARSGAAVPLPASCPLCLQQVGESELIFVSDGSVPTCSDHRLCFLCALRALDSLANSFPSELGPLAAQHKCLFCGPAGGRGRTTITDLRHLIVDLGRRRTLTRTGTELFAETLLAKLDTARSALLPASVAAPDNDPKVFDASAPESIKACPACGSACTRDGGCPTVRCACWHSFRWCCMAPAESPHASNCPAELELARVFVEVELVFRARAAAGELSPPPFAAPPPPSSQPVVSSCALLDQSMTDAVLVYSA